VRWPPGSTTFVVKAGRADKLIVLMAEWLAEAGRPDGSAPAAAPAAAAV
jgi:hypothetical protein